MSHPRTARWCKVSTQRHLFLFDLAVGLSLSLSFTHPVSFDLASNIEHVVENVVDDMFTFIQARDPPTLRD
jgi:hypothetical protein